MPDPSKSIPVPNELSQPPSAQEFEIAGKTFLLVSKEVFQCLSRDAALPLEELQAFGAVAIGRALRQKRLKAGLTQAELARRAGIRSETLSRLENGHGNSTLGTLEAIHRALRSC
jgi:DNA-binding XRE family transcriptional regulator